MKDHCGSKDLDEESPTISVGGTEMSGSQLFFLFSLALVVGII